jgi:hypothetical protein
VTGGLKYYLHDAASSFRFKLAGSLAGADVAELRQCWNTASSTLGSRPFVVDIDGLRGADQDGRALLREWHAGGARIVAASARARLLAQSITGSEAEWVKTVPSSHGLYLRYAAMVSTAALMLMLPVTVLAETPAPAPLPKVVLAHYAAVLDQNLHVQDKRDVAVEIEASLPKLEQHGRLQAIRRWVMPGKPEYSSMRLEGDKTVRQQVIARYLSAEEQAGAMPSSAVAISPANYRFHYIGVIGPAAAPVYVFHIAPRQKRAGLIQGELWIDAASGRAVRKTGRLVKRPSVFVRSVNMVQDTDMVDDAPAVRITHLEIDTRLAGRAELTIRERFCGVQGGPDDEFACSTTE